MSSNTESAFEQSKQDHGRALFASFLARSPLTPGTSYTDKADDFQRAMKGQALVPLDLAAMLLGVADFGESSELLVRTFTYLR